MIKDNLGHVLKKMQAACAQTARPFSDITLVAVTKGVELPQIEEALIAGVRHIGENRIQEALLKYGPLKAYAVERRYELIWHMIGHLQTNKVKEAVKIFDLIHSVDSLRLAQKIDKEAGNIGKIQDILLEVKTSEEATKYGFLPDEILKVFPEITVLKNIRVKGLMTIAPLVEDARQYFRHLRELRDKINQSLTTCHQPLLLSMGMTDDFEIAIEEGATMVRIGRGIFGERKI